MTKKRQDIHIFKIRNRKIHINDKIVDSIKHPNDKISYSISISKWGSKLEQTKQQKHSKWTEKILDFILSADRLGTYIDGNSVLINWDLWNAANRK